jgi:hypothetical protein
MGVPFSGGVCGAAVEREKGITHSKNEATERKKRNGTDKTS